MKRILAAFSLVLVVVLSLGGAAGAKDPVYPLGIEVLGTHPGETDNHPQIVPTSGWTITIALKALQEPLGIAARTSASQFPTMGNFDDRNPEKLSVNNWFMILADPDYVPATGHFLLSMIPGYYMYTNPDTTVTSPAICLPTMDCYWHSADINETFLEFKPGSGIPSDVGTTGYSTRLPGLVVLSDTGIGNQY